MFASFVHQSFLSRVICKPGAVDLLPNALVSLGCKRPLVLNSARVASSQLFQQVTQLLQGMSVANISAIAQLSTAMNDLAHCPSDFA